MTKFSRRNLIFKNEVLLLGKDECISVTRLCQKVVKRGSNRLKNIAFWNFLVNVNCMNKFWKSKFQTFLKTLKNWCSAVQNSRYPSRKSSVTITEFSRETLFFKKVFFVLRNGECRLITRFSWNFHFLEKTHCFYQFWEFCEYNKVSNVSETADFWIFEAPIWENSKSENSQFSWGGVLLASHIDGLTKR